MSTVSLSAVVLCVSLLAAVFLSYLFPTLRLPSSSASSAAVLEAAYLGDLNEVRRLLAVYSNQSHSQQRQQPQRSIDALLRDSRNNTALHWAVKEARPHSLAVIDELIAAGLSLATVNAAGTTALHWSVHSDSDEIITGIIHRLCPGVKDSQHTPPTPAATTQHTAARRQLPVCDALLAKNERNETALHWAVDWQKPVAVSTLLRLADGSRSSVSAATTASRDLVHVADVNGDTPLHRLPIDCPSSAACRLIAQQLIARGANVTAENKAHRTPLAHFPTPTDEGHAGDGRERAVLRDAGALEELDEQAEEFKRNVTQQFDTV